MKLATARIDGALVPVMNAGDGWVPIDTDEPSTLSTLIAGEAQITPKLDVAPEAGIRFGPPLVPGKIVAIGLNYRDHVRETGLELPTVPLVFTKFTSSIIGDNDDIEFDATVTERVDWEVELVAVVGKTMRNVPKHHALEYVFGYTVANDVSARDVQFSDGQWIRGKSLDTFCPLGPFIVTADEIPDPQNLQLWTRVNGEIVQQSTTSEMIFDVATLLEFCSRSFTLEPGDIVLTGTPWGCGEWLSPRRSLCDGDVLETEVGGIGTLINTVRRISVGQGNDRGSR